MPAEPTPYLIVRLSEQELSEQILSVQTTSPSRDVVLDFSKVSYVSSQHLGQLLKVRQHLSPHDRRIRLFGLQPAVRNLFRLTSLDVLLEIYESEAEAVASLQ